MFIISENPSITKPKNIKMGKDKIRFEAVLQTANECNRNRRYYSKEVLKEGIKAISNRIKEGGLCGECDHPLSQDPSRQVTVLYKEASHRFLELGWDGNKLVGVLETLRTPNGTILKNLAEDGIPIGFSFRGLGELRQTIREGKTINEVTPPISVITWDSVSYPSHAGANLVRVLEQDISSLQESAGLIIGQEDGMVITEGGVFEANDYEEILNEYVNFSLNRFNIKK